ncbi:MAG TPA: hypothetical protein GYA07_13065 [Verrucomicrobia bacterium]|nr:hypothetical protein [Verrucomicrobiota bacterium]
MKTVWGKRRRTPWEELNLDGSDSDEWTMTFYDFVGRPYKTVYADSGTPWTPYDNPFSIRYYNNQGQVWKEVDPDGVTTLYVYNAKGEREYTITALAATTRNMSSYASLLSSLNSIKGGVDRITQTVSDVVSAHGTHVHRTRTYVWGTNGSPSPTLVSMVERSVNGLTNWHTIYNGGVPATTTTITVPGSTRTVTTIAPDNSYTISVYHYGRLASVTRYDSTGTPVGGTSYGYVLLLLELERGAV